MDIAQREQEAEVKLVAPDVLVEGELEELAAAKAGCDAVKFVEPNLTSEIMKEETNKAQVPAASGTQLKTDGTGGEKLMQKTIEPQVAEGVELPKDCKLPDNYRVLEKVGEGGMGQVFKVEDQALKQNLAVKMMNPQYIGDKAALKRFEKEAAAAGDLTHANIAQVYNCSTEGDSPYILMEYVDGISFAQLLKDERTLDEQRLITICLQICDALDYAHRRGIVHRDLKPSNIILKQPGDLVKIVDFGIAKLASEKGGATQLTQKGEIFGSPQYMSPEQAKGALVDYRADLYSLGCIMYESLSGQPLFGGDNAVQILLQHINASVKPYMSILLGKGCSASMVTIIRKLLEKDASKRYQSAEELSRDLWRVLERKRPKALTNMQYVFDMPIFIKTKVAACGMIGLLAVTAFLHRDAILRTMGIHSVNQQFINANGTPNRVVEAKQMLDIIDSGDEAAAAIAAKELLSLTYQMQYSSSILEKSAQSVLLKNYNRYTNPELKEDLFKVLTSIIPPSEETIALTIKLANTAPSEELQERAANALSRWNTFMSKKQIPAAAVALANNIKPTTNSWQIATALHSLKDLPDDAIAIIRKKVKEPWTFENGSNIKAKLMEALLKRVSETGDFYPEVLTNWTPSYGSQNIWEILAKLGPRAKAWAPALFDIIKKETSDETPPLPPSLMPKHSQGQIVYLNPSTGVIDAIGNIGEPIADKAVPILADGLVKWPHTQQKLSAAIALSKMGPPGKEALITATKSSIQIVADAAKYALRLKPPKRAINAVDYTSAPQLYGATNGTIGPQGDEFVQDGGE